MRTLNHIEVEHLAPIRNGKVDGLPCGLPELVENRTAALTKHRLMIRRGGKPHQLGSDEVRAGITAEKISFAFEMSERMRYAVALLIPVSFATSLRYNPAGAP
jgi:hypothetical protein